MSDRINLLGSLMTVAWSCKCGHGVTRHCTRCGVCHINQSGRGNPFLDWCGCTRSVPVWVRMAAR